MRCRRASGPNQYVLDLVNLPNRDLLRCRTKASAGKPGARGVAPRAYIRVSADDRQPVLGHVTVP